MRRLPAPLILTALLAGCVPPPRPVPAPAPARPVPIIAPAPPPPATADWRDGPLTPGDWRYRPRLAQYVAPGGAVLLTLGCASGALALGLAGEGPATIRTTALAPTVMLAGGRVAIATSDPLVDALGFSRGRFVVERAGAAPLVVPAWPEVLRAAEDCRD